MQDDRLSAPLLPYAYGHFSILALERIISWS